MEVHTTMVYCTRCGRSYDSSQHRECPYCSTAGRFTPTEPPMARSGDVMTETINGPMAEPVRNFTPTTPPIMREPAQVGVTEIGGPEPQGDVEPVVGWLVCVEGPSRGKDFRLHAGYNYIGRDTGDVRITGDMQVSRQNHAMVAYDSGEHRYFVAPAGGRNLIKVNGSAVLQAVEVRSYDVVSIGTTKLMFVCLCGDQFSWESPNG